MKIKSEGEMARVGSNFKKSPAAGSFNIIHLIPPERLNSTLG